MEKSNKKMMLLSAFGILFVLDDHVGSPIGLFTNIFPYNSFYMPMFVFSSGYFFKVKRIENFCKYLFDKMKHFLLPFILYNVAYLIVSLFLQSFGIVWFKNSGIFNVKDFFISVFTTGTPVDICSSLWFVMVLFAVVITYAVLRKIIPVWNDWIWFIVFVTIGGGCVYIAHNRLFNPLFLLFVKLGFFIQFYQFGILYRRFIEKFEKKYGLIILLSCILINVCF